jgi:hypothetical protein
LTIPPLLPVQVLVVSAQNPFPMSPPQFFHHFGNPSWVWNRDSIVLTSKPRYRDIVSVTTSIVCLSIPQPKKYFWNTHEWEKWSPHHTLDFWSDSW